jgi:hypothetical protein
MNGKRVVELTANLATVAVAIAAVGLLTVRMRPNDALGVPFEEGELLEDLSPLIGGSAGAPRQWLVLVVASGCGYCTMSMPEFKVLGIWLPGQLTEALAG